MTVGQTSQYGTGCSGVLRELVEGNALLCYGTTTEKFTNVVMDHADSPHYKMWYACKVQAALCRAIGGDDMYTLSPHLDHQPHNCHLTIKITIAVSFNRCLGTLRHQFKAETRASQLIRDSTPSRVTVRCTLGWH